jgi:hypothetical protein
MLGSDMSHDIYIYWISSSRANKGVFGSGGLKFRGVTLKRILSFRSIK